MSARRANLIVDVRRGSEPYFCTEFRARSAPGSIVVIGDEEWLVTSAEQGADGWLVRVRGLSELVVEATAAFYASLDTIEVQDPQ